MSGPAGKIQAIHRYPVEGLTPEPLPRATLAVRQTIPCDRIYAIENGPSGFDAAEPGRARRPSDAGGARRDRNILCGILRRRIARAGQGAARGGPQLSDV